MFLVTSKTHILSQGLSYLMLAYILYLNSELSYLLKGKLYLITINWLDESWPAVPSQLKLRLRHHGSKHILHGQLDAEIGQLLNHGFQLLLLILNWVTLEVVHYYSHCTCLLLLVFGPQIG